MERGGGHQQSYHPSPSSLGPTPQNDDDNKPHQPSSGKGGEGGEAGVIIMKDNEAEEEEEKQEGGEEEVAVVHRGSCVSFITGLPRMMISNWKVLLFVSLLACMAILSGTVLKEPFERSAALWVRGRGRGGYALFGLVGWLFIMVGGSTTLFEVIAGYVYGLMAGFIISFTVKVCVAVCSFAIARHVLREWLRTRLLDKYVYMAAIAELIRAKPWSSVLLIRASALPTVVKNYGMGSLGARWLPFLVTACFTFAIKSFVLVDLGSNLKGTSQGFGARNEGTQVLEYSVLAVCVVTILFGMYYGRKYAKQIMDADKDRRRTADKDRLRQEEEEEEVMEEGRA